MYVCLRSVDFQNIEMIGYCIVCKHLKLEFFHIYLLIFIFCVKFHSKFCFRSVGENIPEWQIACASTYIHVHGAVGAEMFRFFYAIRDSANFRNTQSMFVVGIFFSWTLMQHSFGRVRS